MASLEADQSSSSMTKTMEMSAAVNMVAKSARPDYEKKGRGGLFLQLQKQCTSVWGCARAGTKCTSLRVDVGLGVLLCDKLFTHDLSQLFMVFTLFPILICLGDS